MTRPISPGQADANASQRLKAQRHDVREEINKALLGGERVIDIGTFLSCDQAHWLAEEYDHEGWSVVVEDRRAHIHATTAWRFFFRVSE